VRLAAQVRKALDGSANNITEYSAVRFVAITYGTEGDTRPIAALCRTLLDAGHEALLFGDRSALGSAHALGVPAHGLAGDIKSALHATEGLAKLVRRGSRFTDTARALAQLANANTEAWMRDIAAAGRGCEAIILSGLAAFAGLSVAEYLGVTAIGAGLIPITPTRAFSSPFLRPGLLPGWLNRWSHNFVNATLWRAFRKATNAARERVCGLPPRTAVWKDHPILYGVSPNLLPRPADWPSHAHLCGQWLPPAGGWSPPPALESFLAAAERPIYVGFGSMAGFDQHGLLAEVIAAVAGRRAVFYPGWSGLEAATLPPNFFVVEDTPHSWLFPRMSAVMHHGGSGTTHSAARAGVPSIVVPFAADQFFWADRLRRLGVASEPVRAGRVRAAALAHSIAFAESPGARSNAAALGARMATENGLENALSVIEALTSKRSGSSLVGDYLKQGSRGSA
jgi:sterol 3beta-glucosyltransferase